MRCIALAYFVFTVGLPGEGGPVLVSELERVAAGMGPGTWATLTTQGPPAGSPTINLTYYSDSAGWDPIAREFRYISTSRTPGGGYGFAVYNEQTNSWSTIPVPQPTGFGHGYDQNTGNPATGDHYFIYYMGNTVYKYSPTSSTWSTLPPAPSSVWSPTAAVALQHFPEMGGLALVGGGIVAFFDLGTNQWRGLARNLAMGSYHNFAQYSAVYRTVIFGGGNGSSDVYKLDSTGTITKMRNAPNVIGVNQTVESYDPVSGKYLVLQQGTGTLYEYDVTSDTWNLLNATGPTMDLCVAPIPALGVNMFVNFDGAGKPTVWLYKHSAGGGPPSPDTQPPSVPMGLTATAVSSSQINLSWTASTDNVGVTGYRIYRGGTQIATTAGTTYSDAGLSASTTYTYTVAAYDAAGNVSGQSSSSSATTRAPGSGQPPVVSFTNPIDGAILSGTVAVNARANDPDVGTADGAGIANVVFELRQGSTVVDQITEFLVTYDWSLNTTSYPDGVYTLRATATGTAAAGGTSTSVSISVLISHVPGSDSDGDGLPDAWEWQYFGNFAPLPTDDPDGDGYTNLQEYQAGSDPTSAASIPGSGGGGGGGGCGATGMELVVAVALLGRRRRRQQA